MIENEYKLDRCTKGLKLVAKAIENEFGSVNIHSGSRTQAENDAADGASGSMHLSGRAIDLSVKNVHIIKVASFLLYNIIKYPYTRIAINLKGNWLHVDDKESVTVPDVYFYQNGKWVK